MIVVVGEALVDVMRSPTDTVEYVGGGPLNVAVGCARLDQPTLLVAEVGDDERGQAIRQHLARNDVALLAVPASEHTSSATATLDEDGRAEYDFDIGWTLPTLALPACDVLHVGSLGTVLEPGRYAVADLVDQAWQRDVFCSYDPNLRRQFLGDPEATWRDVESLADRANLVKLSEGDIALAHPGADPTDIARSLLTGERTELVVVTHGGDGSSAFSSVAEVRVAAPAVPLVDTIGAGDSFMSALLVVLMLDGALSSYGPAAEAGLPRAEGALTRLLEAAAQAAAVTCSRPAADPPWPADLPDGWPR